MLFRSAGFSLCDSLTTEGETQRQRETGCREGVERGTTLPEGERGGKEREGETKGGKEKR